MVAVLGSRRQAALHSARKRRRSLLSDANLFRTRRLPAGDTLALADQFPNTLAPVTFEGVLDFSAGSTSTVLSTGLLSLRTTAAGLSVVYGSFAPQTVTVSDQRRIRFNLAFRPGDAQVRLWLDSELVVASQFGLVFPLAWHAGGTLTYSDTAGADLIESLSVYALQRPRHFGEARAIVSGVTPDSDILYRAAIATFLTGSFPFLENPQ